MSNEVKKIRSLELKMLQESSNALNQAVYNIGVLEVQRDEVFKKYEEAKKDHQDVIEAIKEKYGDVKVNLSTGEYFENSESEE